MENPGKGGEHPINSTESIDHKNAADKTTVETPNIQPGNILEDLGIAPKMVLYTSSNEPVTIESVDSINGYVKIVNSKGKHLKYKVENNLVSHGEDSMDHLVLKNDKRTLYLSLMSPLHKEVGGVSLEHETGILDLDPGDTFLDSENNSWKVSKILENTASPENDPSFIIQIESESGEKEYVFLRDWGQKNKKDTLRSIGNRLNLTRSVGGEVDPESANIVEQSADRYTISSLSLATGDQVFKLEKGQSYTDINNEKWTVTGILSLPNEKKYKIAIESADKEQKAILLKEWDSYTDAVLMVDEVGDSFMFTPIEQEAPVIEETPIEETEEIPETPTVEIPKTNLGVEDIAELNAAAKEEAEDVQQRNLPATQETLEEQPPKETTENSSEPETPKEKEEVKETIEESNEPEEQKERKLEEIEKELQELEKKIARRNKIFEHFERVVK